MDMSLQEVDPINSNPVTISKVDVILDDAETPKLCYWLLCSFPRLNNFTTRSGRLQSSSPFFIEAKKSNEPFTNLKTVTMRYNNFVGACTDLLPMGAGVEFLNFLVARSPEIQFVTLIRKGIDSRFSRNCREDFQETKPVFSQCEVGVQTGGFQQLWAGPLGERENFRLIVKLILCG